MIVGAPMSRLGLLLLASGWLTACGGSSSETPFPLEPDLERLEGKPATRYIVVSEGRRAGDAGVESEPTEQAEPPAEPAAPTWGAPAATPDAATLPEVPLQ
jgi:hypothetical protein